MTSCYVYTYHKHNLFPCRYYRIYCIGLNTVFASIIPLLSLVYLNICTVTGTMNDGKISITNSTSQQRQKKCLNPRSCRVSRSLSKPLDPCVREEKETFFKDFLPPPLCWEGRSKGEVLLCKRSERNPFVVGGGNLKAHRPHHARICGSFSSRKMPYLPHE